MRKIMVVLLFLMAMTIFVIGCDNSPKDTKNADIKEKATTVNDYFDDGVFLAALSFYSWQDTASMAKAYPVTILEEASETNDQKAKIKLQISVKTAEEAEDDKWSWTPFVFKSRPALKNDLKVGEWILCVDEKSPLDKKALKKSEWLYRQIKSLDNVDKGLVEVSYNDTYHHEEKSTEVNIKNIRFVENPVLENEMNF